MNIYGIDHIVQNSECQLLQVQVFLCLSDKSINILRLIFLILYSEKQENDHGLTLREREFMEEYESLLQTMGKDAVIHRENKTKPRKKKAALDDAKDG